MNVLQQIWAFVCIVYLHMFWALAFGYIGCWLVALIISAARRPGVTVIHACRQAWAWAFMVHLLFTLAVAGFWWNENHSIKSYYTYLPFYVIPIVFDIFMIFRIRAGLEGFRSYHRSDESN